MIIEKRIKEFRHWIGQFFEEKKQVITTTERCCFHLTNQEISFIHLNKTEDAYELLNCETIAYEDDKQFLSWLSKITKKHQLTTIPAYLLLPLNDYQLFIIESLPVATDEFQEALDWRVKSLIDFPFEEAVLDHFLLPPKKATPNHPLIAAVVAKRDLLFKLISTVKKAAIDLTTIDIPELALRNLTSLYEYDEKTTAFIYFYDDVALLNITRQRTLYFTRRINLPTVTDPNIRKYEQIGLEILRYFDYFQSQWRHPSPTRILIGSQNDDLAEIAKELSEYLLVKVDPFTLRDTSFIKGKLDTFNNKCLLALGCVLREDV